MALVALQPLCLSPLPWYFLLSCWPCHHSILDLLLHVSCQRQNYHHSTVHVVLALAWSMQQEPELCYVPCAGAATAAAMCPGSEPELLLLPLPLAHALGWMQPTRSLVVYIWPRVQGEFDTHGLEVEGIPLCVMFII